MFKNSKNNDLFKGLDIKKWLLDNIVSVIFITLTVLCLMVSQLTFGFFMSELVTRFFRNSFLVLSLLLPVIAGIGLNFGIVVGAMAAQIGIIAISYFNIGGILGLLVAVAIAIPCAILFGYLTGVLYNKTKGQEMIAGLIVGYFANGIYQFIFMFVIGVIILVPNTNPIIKPDGIGLRNTLDLDKGGEGIKYALDGILKAPFIWCLLIGILLFAGYLIYKQYLCKKSKSVKTPQGIFFAKIAGCLAVVVFCLIAFADPFLMAIDIPVVTGLIILALCIGTSWILKTKLGQDFKSVGNNQHIAEVSGINVDRTRIIAVILSTVLAAIGQLIFLQNVGTMNTFGSHMQVGMFAIAALLIGGASVTNANTKQALLGTILFHAVFIISPDAGKQLFGQAQIGEFFRTFVSYGVIGVSLGLYAWRANGPKLKKKKK